MEHLHTPERLSGESFEEYKARRAASQREVIRILSGTPLTRLAYAALGHSPGRVDRMRQLAKSKRPKPTQPKFAEPRKRKAHHHPLRDQHGAYTLVGKRGNYEVIEGHDEHGDPIVRLGQHQPRMWLAGISALRGY